MKRLEDKTKDELQAICINLGMGIDLLWGKKQMIWLLHDRKEVLESSMIFNKEQLMRLHEETEL